MLSRYANGNDRDRKCCDRSQTSPGKLTAGRWGPGKEQGFFSVTLSVSFSPLKGTSQQSREPKCSATLHLPFSAASVKCNKRRQPVLDWPFGTSANSGSIVVLHPPREQRYRRAWLWLRSQLWGRRSQLPLVALPVCPVPQQSSSLTIRHHVQDVPCSKCCPKLHEHQPCQPPKASAVANCWYSWGWGWQVLAEFITAGTGSCTNRDVATELLLWST